jgi:Holliday junction resolvasome RuvABC endonuclease subunit
MNDSIKIDERNIILGISPGTMYTGIAIFQNGGLIEWRVKTFYGKITKKKLQRILNAVEAVIDSYAVDSIAIKIPEGNCTSEKVWQLIGDIKKMAGNKKLPIFRYSLSELKQLCLGDDAISRKDLAEYLMQKYPKKLSFVGESRRLNKHTYYGKMFEAVAAGMQRITKT